MPLPTLAILAGGASTRMTTPKSHLLIHNQPILEYLLSRLNWPAPTLLITSPTLPHPPGHHLFSRELHDPTPHQGPLQGLLTALQSLPSPSDTLLALTVDMPAISPHHLHHLITSLSSHRPTTLGLLLRRPPTTIEPFPSIYRQPAAQVIQHHLSTHQRSVHSLLTHPSFTTTDAPPAWPPETWNNLNHPQDLAAFLKSSPSTES